MAEPKGKAIKADPEETKPKVEKPTRSDPDRVAMVSYDAEGNPAQSDGFEVIGE